MIHLSKFCQVDFVMIRIKKKTFDWVNHTFLSEATYTFVLNPEGVRVWVCHHTGASCFLKVDGGLSRHGWRGTYGRAVHFLTDQFYTLAIETFYACYVSR